MTNDQARNRAADLFVIRISSLIRVSGFGIRICSLLTPEQIHALAHKGEKAACHSDNVANPDEAQLVQINTLKAHGVAVNESGL